MKTDAKNASAQTPREEPSADRIRVAYECHTLAQMLLERISGASAPAPGVAPHAFAFAGFPPMPWPGVPAFCPRETHTRWPGR